MKRFQKISFQVVFTFLLAVIPIIIATLLFIQQSADTAKDEMYQFLSAQGVFVQNQLEDDLDKLRRRQQELVFSDNLVQLAYTHDVMSNYEIRQAVLAIYDQINTIEEFSESADNVKIFVPSLAHVYSYGSNLSAYSTQEDNILLEKAQGTAFSICNIEGVIHMLMPYPSHALMDGIRFLSDIPLSNVWLSETLSNVLPDISCYVYLSNDVIDYDITDADDTKSALSLLSQAKILATSDDTKENIVTLLIHNEEYLYLKHPPSINGFYLSALIPSKNVLGHLDRFQDLIFVLIAVSFLMIFWFFVRMKKTLNEPIQTLHHVLSSFQQGQFDIHVQAPRPNEFVDIYSGLNDTAMQLKSLIDTVYHQQIAAQQAKLKHLQSQINPHFLYNSFFVIYNMAQLEDYEGIQELSQAMADYYRYVSKNSGDKASLKQEYDYATTYMTIQKIRFGKSTVSHLDELPQDLVTMRVPKLLMQPVLENAYKYAFKDHSKQYQLKVTFQTDEQSLHIFIEDSGETLTDEHLKAMQDHLITPDAEQWGSGIINVQQRLQLGCPEGSGLILSRSSLGGLCVEMILFFEK